MESRWSASSCAAVALTAIALLAQGCGGGSGSSSTSTSVPAGVTGGTVPPVHVASGAPLTRAQLISSADLICRRANQGIAANTISAPTLKEIARVSPANEVLEHKALIELEKLPPPPAMTHEWHHLLEIKQALIVQLLKVIRYARSKDEPAVKALAASKKQLHSTLGVTAFLLGSKDCGQLG